MILTKQFNGNFLVSFDAFMQEKELLVNATEMANIFDSKAANFLRLDSTQKTIIALEKKYGNKKYDEKTMFQVSDLRLENEISVEKNDFQVAVPQLETENLEVKISENIVNVIHGGRNNGTWMHRILALEFAMWLDVDFKIWVIETIEEILFGYARLVEKSLQKTVLLQHEIKTLEAKADEIPDLKRYLDLKEEISNVRTGRGKSTSDRIKELQMDLFPES